MAYVLRFTQRKIKDKIKRSAYFTSTELDKATTIVVELVQCSVFSPHKQKLMNKEKVVTNISSLNPFNDKNGNLRVGGRLANAKVNYNCKHPIIIPHKSHLTTLLIHHAHKTTLHGGKNMTLAYIRQRYWIIKGPLAVKNYINHCVRCHKYKGRTMQQLMGHLPESRITPTRPFTHTGVDYAGPVQLRMSKGRGRKCYKGYLAIFVCFAVKAIHIEVVGDLTAKAFIAAFKRFTARRGYCSDIYSDCGTNFVGADRLMQRTLVQTIQTANKAAAKILENEGTRWHFIPPASPHMGGIWEAAVKSTKYHLKRVIGEQILTYEELTTITNQIEACLNSRPLTPLNSDSNDLQILTPGHFLIGEPIIVHPEPCLLNENISWLKRWELVRRIAQDFWRAWFAEYVLLLQRRAKWTGEQANIAIGELVLVKDNNMPPGKWPLARVSEVHPGIDRNIRVVTLKGTDGSTFKRPITKISPLPTEDNRNLREAAYQEAKEADKETKNEPEKSKAYHRKTRVSKAIYAPLIILATIINLCASTIPQSFNITKFDNEPGLYFEYITDVRFTNNNWNIIVYYNLTNYYAEFETYKNCIEKMNKFCQYPVTNFTNNSTSNRVRREICALINPQFQQTLLEIEHKDELLHNKKANFGRSKRALLNIIGNIASDLFGVLDDRDAARYQQEIERLSIAQDHSLALMKNQTSIIDATVNIFKKRQEDIDQHWILFKEQLTQALDASDSNTNLLALSVHTLLLMIAFKETQDTLIEAVLDTHNSVISTRLLTTHQLKDELDIMAGNLPVELMLPTIEDIDDILGLYQIMTSKSKLVGNYLIFEVKIPLIYKEQYQIYKVIPLPTTSKPSVVIEPQMDFLVTTLHRDAYYPMSVYEWQQCLISNGFSICELLRAIQNNQGKNTICELHLLRQESVTSKCRIMERISNELPDTWVQLQDHRWLYSVQEEHTINIVCQQRPLSTKLSRSGILSLGPNCALKDNFISIPARQVYYHRIEASLLPEFNLSNAITFELEPRRPHFKDLSQFAGVEEVQQRIKEQIANERNTLSYHDIHHYAFAYGALAIVIIIVMIYMVVKVVRRNPKNRAQAQPAVTIPPLAEI